MRSNKDILASLKQERSVIDAKGMSKQLIVKRTIPHGRDGAYLASLLQVVKGEKSRPVSCSAAITIAFHSGKSGGDCVGDVIEIPKGCEVRYGRDCQVRCYVVDITGESLLLYIERISLDGQPDVWRLRRVRSIGGTSGPRRNGTSPLTSVKGGRRVGGGGRRS